MSYSKAARELFSKSLACALKIQTTYFGAATMKIHRLLTIRSVLFGICIATCVALSLFAFVRFSQKNYVQMVETKAPIYPALAVNDKSSTDLPVSGTPINLKPLQLNSVSPLNTEMQRYKARPPVQLAIHEAISSRDIIKLRYANIYLNRCIQITYWAKGDVEEIAASPQTSPSVSSSIRDLQRMCGGRDIQTEARRLNAAISAATDNWQLLQRDSQGNTNAQLADTIVSQRDGELLFDIYMKARTSRTPTPFDGIGQCGISNPILSSFCELAVLSAICVEWQCDKEYQMAKFCGLFYICVGTSMDNQIDFLFELSQKSGADPLFSSGGAELWDGLKGKSRAVLRTLSAADITPLLSIRR